MGAGLSFDSATAGTGSAGVVSVAGVCVTFETQHQLVRKPDAHFAYLFSGNNGLFDFSGRFLNDSRLGGFLDSSDSRFVYNDRGRALSQLGLVDSSVELRRIGDGSSGLGLCGGLLGTSLLLLAKDSERDTTTELGQVVGLLLLVILLLGLCAARVRANESTSVIIKDRPITLLTAGSNLTAESSTISEVS